MEEQQFQEAIKKVEKELDELVARYGVRPVMEELQRQLPKFDFSEALRDDAELNEADGFFSKKPGQSWGSWAVGKALSALGIAAPVIGGGLSMIGGGLRGMVGKKVDQDVNIADIEPGVVLKVSNPGLEDLILKTNELLAAMANQMVQDLEQLDISMDHVAAGITGATVQDIRGQQATGQTTRQAQDLTTGAPLKLKDEEPEEEEPEMPAPAPPPRLAKK